MTREVYKIVVQHYMEDDEGNKIMLDEPIVCQNIYDKSYTIGHPESVVLNDMFNKIRAFVLEKAVQN